MNEITWWSSKPGKTFLEKHNGANGDREQIHLAMLSDKDMLGTIIAMTRGKQKSIARYARYLLAEISGQEVIHDDPSTLMRKSGGGS